MYIYIYIYIYIYTDVYISVLHEISSCRTGTVLMDWPILRKPDGKYEMSSWRAGACLMDWAVFRKPKGNMRYHYT